MFNGTVLGSMRFGFIQLCPQAHHFFHERAFIRNCLITNCLILFNVPIKNDAVRNIVIASNLLFELLDLLISPSTLLVSFFIAFSVFAELSLEFISLIS